MAARFLADGRVGLAIGALAVLAVCATPLLLSIGQAFSSPPSGMQWPLWWPSVSLAAGGASVALTVALLGHAAAGAHGRGRVVWIVLALTAACALPSYVHALTWSWVASAWLPGKEPLIAACVLGFSYAPMSFLVLIGTLRPAPRQWFEAAWTSGLSPRVAWWLVARRNVPAWLATWLIAFLLCFSDFPVADHFRVATYATEVFARVAAWLSPAEAARLALPILLTALVLVAALMFIFRRLETAAMPISAAGPRPARSPPSIPRIGAAIAFVALVAGVPVAMLLTRVPSVQVMSAAFRTWLPDLAGTLILGLGAGVATAVLAAVLALFEVRRLHRASRIGRVVAWAALAWPASLLCLGAIALASAAFARQPALEWLPILAVLVLRWLVLPYEVWRTFWMRIPPNLEESGWMVGLPWWQALGGLFWRQASVVFAAAVLLVAGFSINDLTVFVLLAPPGFSTTTLNIFSAVHYGPGSYLSALCLTQVLVVAALVAPAALLLLRRGSPHVDG
jgi:ABC-type Fe3+ transport system permease subunit